MPVNALRRLLAGLLAFLSVSQSQAQGIANKDPEQAGRELRSMFLSMPPGSMGLSPTKEFPRVFAVAMDWPVDEEIATIVSASDGTASLYTTSSFGIIGGQSHESVRAAAQRFVQAAERLHDEASPVTAFPYPAQDKVRFYLRTFAGLRVIEAEAESIYSGQDRYSEFFGMGQAVLTELREVTEEQR